MSEFLSPSEARVLIAHYLDLFLYSDPDFDSDYLGRAESFIKYLSPGDPFIDEISHYRVLSYKLSLYPVLKSESEVDFG